MEAPAEKNLLRECLKRIESQLGWGSSENWTNQDFEALSEKIQEVTGVYLSITTLKRIWGKVRYESSPTLSTLNALSKFIGFENWRAFAQSLSVTTQIGSDPIHSGNTSSSKKIWVPAIALAVLSSVFLFYLFSSEKTIRPEAAMKSVNLDSSQFSFSSKKVVSSGVPNSVIFDYDASKASSADSIFIQQSWDRRLTQQVSANEHQHTSIYYYPGFFVARLVVNDQIVKFHPLFIQTDGWLPLVEQSPVPVYFSEAEAKQNGAMRIAPEQLKEKNITLQPQTPWVDFYNVRNFGDLQTNNFILEAELKNDFQEGSGICGNTEIKILSEGSAINIPLSAKGCVSDLKMYLLDHEVNGKTQDLSAFGCDLFSWTDVKCVVNENHLTIYVDGAQAYDVTLTASSTKITGIVFRFQGGGSVKSVSLATANGKNVYEDRF